MKRGADFGSASRSGAAGITVKDFRNSQKEAVPCFNDREASRENHVNAAITRLVTFGRRALSTAPQVLSTETVQQRYSKKRRNPAQIGLQGPLRRIKAKVKIPSTSRPILNFRRRRIDRGVEQPGNWSVRPHIAKNQLVLKFVQQWYSRIDWALN